MNHLFFFSSRSCKTLFHGMSHHLSFKTLYCTFDAPTSTTTASSVAANFAQNGIVIQFESNDSTGFIKTLDMGLFTCYDQEEEHLIFETRLHIKDIWIPSEHQWIGKNMMNRLSLCDLLIHGNVVRDDTLLKPKNQKRLSKLLHAVINNTIATYTSSSYTNNLIKSLIQENKKIWLHLKQISELEDVLKSLLIDENGGFGKLIEHLKTKFDVIICPIFLTNWKMNKSTFEFISRSSDVKQKNIQIIVPGPTIECNMPGDKSVVFQPQLTKHQNIFDVEMKLISVYKHLDIKVHFNIECK
eukprot:459645_1